MKRRDDRGAKYGSEGETDEGRDNGENEPRHVDGDDDDGCDDLEERSQRLDHKVRNHMVHLGKA